VGGLFRGEDQVGSCRNNKGKAKDPKPHPEGVEMNRSSRLRKKTGGRGDPQGTCCGERANTGEKVETVKVCHYGRSRFSVGYLDGEVSMTGTRT